MSKRCSLAAAIAQVRDGQRVGLGGMTLYRRPVAAALALAGAGLRGLELVTLTGGIETDLLLGAGCVDRLRACYTGLEVVGFAPHFTRRIQEGSLALVEETEYTLSYALQAATMRVPFLPMRGEILRTGIPDVRPDLRPFTCPLSGATLLAVPALPLDVAIVHATAADEQGNCNLQGQLALDRHLPAAARLTLVTTERIIGTEELRTLPGGINLPGAFVHQVVEVPGGTHPTSCYPTRALDLSAVLDYADAAADPHAWPAWLAQALDAREAPQ